MCGIFGILNKETVPFDYSTFCVLGINNDARGGDSCGVFIDGEVEYGVDKNKLFSHFLYDSALVQATDNCKIALGHCRKASVGKISLETAQPVCIYNKENKIDYVLIHNGTINNYQELAKKYIPNIDITGLTDSQVMARIFYYTGYDALGEYRGGAVFVAVDYRKGEPRVYMFKGASKKYQYSKDMEEERPLFISRCENELVFSSIRTYLEVLRPNNPLNTLAANTLVGYKEGKLYALKTYDRSKCYQNKEVACYSNSNNNYVSCVGSMTYDFDNMRYLLRGKPLHGEYWVGRYGTVWDQQPNSVTNSTKMYFFEGIAIPLKESYHLICRRFKSADMEIEDFIYIYENVIRYLSFDQLFIFDKLLVKATSATDFETYNGDHQMIGQAQVHAYTEGKHTETKPSYGNYPDIHKIPVVNVKAIKKIWKP